MKILNREAKGKRGSYLGYGKVLDGNRYEVES